MNFYNWFKIFSRALGTTLLHPQFFSKSFIERNIKKKAKKITGLAVDLGCGNSPYKRYFSHTDYIGLDHPKTLTGESNINISLNVFGDLFSLPFRTCSVDCVILTQVLEHIAEPWKIFPEIERIIKPGGNFLLSTPFFYPLHDEPYDFFRFSPHGLRQLLQKSNFDIIEMIPQGGFITLFAELLNLFCLHKLQNLLGRDSDVRLGYCM